ncbi:hypothetical protein CfE428DRAFT_5823 [Chthoniobacter flavus Ellin428]|uniref:Uncharacterized protein n=1 Tax=Chthoniobacter flavus Ellin428 TaxID=497964 RepID=B4DA83_9BACT|nr:hypothetical protein [Chthoniobacter flavus]EDY16710.1 hypothetical protein CfE428DRAFT_5823 [Chthoniobacter flavus Ellin428]TCO87276.1 hypothetical protein EV701_123113 [Chthoniobacter flavus]
MQHDEDSLKLMHDIANLRAMLGRGGSAALGTGRDHQAVMRRRRELELRIETLTTRFLNLGLKAAGLPQAIDRDTLPLPVLEQRHPRQFATPEIYK